MPPIDPILSVPTALPQGYVAVGLMPDQAGAPVRISIIVRKEPDPVAGHFVVLRSLLDAMVYLDRKSVV